MSCFSTTKDSIWDIPSSIAVLLRMLQGPGLSEVYLEQGQALCVLQVREQKNGPVYTVGRWLLYLWRQAISITGCEGFYKLMGLQGPWRTKGICGMQGGPDRADHMSHSASENLEICWQIQLQRNRHWGQGANYSSASRNWLGVQQGARGASAGQEADRVLIGSWYTASYDKI